MLYHPGLLIPEHETAVIDSLKEATMDDLFPVMRPYYRAELLEAIAHEDTKAQKKQQSRLTALGSLAPASAIQWYPLKDIPAETLRILNPLGQLIRDGHEQYVVAVMKGINNVDGSLTLNPEQVDEILQGGPANNVDLIRIGDSYGELKAGGFLNVALKFAGPVALFSQSIETLMTMVANTNTFYSNGEITPSSMLERAALFGAQFGIRDYELARNELESDKYECCHRDYWEEREWRQCRNRRGVLWKVSIVQCANRLGLQDAVPKLLSTKFDLAYGDERMNLPKCQERFGVPAELKKVERLEDVAKLLIHRHDYEMALQLRR